MTLKAKWDLIHFGNLSTYMWVFVEGRMFAIHEAANDRSAYDQVQISNKSFYEGAIMKIEKQN